MTALWRQIEQQKDFTNSEFPILKIVFPALSIRRRHKKQHFSCTFGCFWIAWSLTFQSSEINGFSGNAVAVYSQSSHFNCTYFRWFNWFWSWQKDKIFFLSLKNHENTWKNKKNVQKLLYLRHSMNSKQPCSLSLTYLWIWHQI